MAQNNMVDRNSTSYLDKNYNFENDEKIYFEEVTHTYTVSGVGQMTPVSTVVGKFFKAFDAAGNVAARYSVFQDFGLGTIDDVTAGMCHKRGEDKFIYFYDTTNVKSVIVTFDGESEQRNNVLYPVLVETKGPNPIEF